MRTMDARRLLFVGWALVRGLAELWALRRARWRDEGDSARAFRT